MVRIVGMEFVSFMYETLSTRNPANSSIYGLKAVERQADTGSVSISSSHFPVQAVLS